MAGVNLSEWAIRHGTLTWFLMTLVVIAGVFSYFRLGQDEDPPFTVKTMIVRAYLPGATIDETMLQLTDRLEKKLQETPDLDYLKSYTLPGETTVYVNLLSSTPKERVPDDWYQVRKKTRDAVSDLPKETVGPFFNDEFGDTYGIIYALTGEGFTHRELKDCAETVRGSLLRVRDVAKVTTIGVQDEKYYVEFSPHTLATLGVSRAAILNALSRQNALTPSGTIDTGREHILVESSGRFADVRDIEDITVYAGDRKIRLGDVAAVRRGLVDPPKPLFRVNGVPAIGIAVSMAKGGDVLRLGENVRTAMRRITASLPAGIDVRQVADQPQVVRQAVGEFKEALFEAVGIVLALSFLSLGLRAGTVVAFSIPLVLAVVFIGMRVAGIDLQRVSLGALIISLGLLVDDATITVESMVSRLESGWDRVRAATYAYTNTAFPMLTGTLVTVFGFIPIGLAKSTAGEYTFSLFAVVGMALLVSWLVAVLFAPPIGERLLKENAGEQGFGGAAQARAFRRALLGVMRYPKMTIAVTLAVFLLSLMALPLVPQQFFPASDRPELLVDLTLHQGVSIRATDGMARRLDAILAKDEDVDHWSTYVGRGAIRFYLPIDEHLPNDFFSQLVVVTRGEEARERVRARLEKTLDEDFPELTARISALELGPPVGWPVQYRLSGPDVDTVRREGEAVSRILAACPGVRKVNTNWGEKGRRIGIRVRQDEARRLGLSTSAVSQAIYSTVEGVSATQVRDDIYLIDVVLRADKAARTDPENLRTLDVPLPNGHSVPLGVLADVVAEQHYPLIWRRDREPTLTVQAETAEGVMPATVVKALEGEISLLERRLPEGCRIETGGTVEESAKSQASVMAAMPLMALLMLIVLMIQLENIRHLVLVLCVAPMGLIGVVGALLITRQPMGFVALLGVVALIGMIVRNSVILVHQIGVEKAGGLGDWDAVVAASVSRFRPIVLTAVTAICGMVPIAPTGFWGPMATAIMGGLLVATVLTLLFLPACYVLWFGIHEKNC
ncbi:MAG: efflux RND transporter permease subunit [Desulfovibrio sp.]|nr:efflux RND transporter permease subunit [Desulfovibrio sp.]